MLGNDLLVVTRWEKKHNLPKGTWREISLVPGDIADTNQVSLCIRAGAIIPLGKVVQNTTEESLDPLTLLVCPDENGRAEGQLYEDDGDGFGYRDGDYCRTTYRAETKDGKVVVTEAEIKGKRTRPSRKVVIEVCD